MSRNSTDGLLLGAWRTTPTFNNEPYLDPRTGLHRSYRFPNPGPGSEQAGRAYDNPLFVANEAPALTEVGRTFGNISGDWSPAGWLSFNYTLGLDYANDERTQGWPWSTSNTTVAGVNGVGGMNAGYIRTTQVDHNLTGTLKFSLGQAREEHAHGRPEPQLAELQEPAGGRHRTDRRRSRSTSATRRTCCRRSISAPRCGSSRTSCRPPPTSPTGCS